MSATDSRSRRLRAPAKINLGLRLMGVREDGYHTLESVFAPIELWDDVEVEVADGPPAIEFRLADPGPARADRGDRIAPRAGLPPALSAVTGGDDNLVVRAAVAFCKETGFDGRVRLALAKRIPAGAGLGGGSSDAAATLLALRDLVEPDLPVAKLHELALGLGADVPFFLDPRPALVRGIGERIEPLDGLPALDLVLVNPGISLATAEVYRATDALRGALTGPRAGSTMRAISELCSETGNLETALGDLLINDLEPAAKRLCPPVARWIGRLCETGALGVSMSGSGSTVFGVYGSSDEARRAGEGLRAAESETSWVRVTRVIPSG